MKPSYNIDNIIAKVNITKCLVDIRYFNYKENLFNLKKNIIYYIKLNLWNYKTLLYLTVYNMNISPFSYLKIYECSSSYDLLSYCERISTLKDLEFVKQNNQCNISIEIKNNYNTRIFFVEIKPEYDINYMLVETKSIYAKNDSKFDVKLFIIIILSFIIIVIIIILIIILGCRKSQLSIDSTVTPLYPNRQTDIDIPNEGY